MTNQNKLSLMSVMDLMTTAGFQKLNHFSSGKNNVLVYSSNGKLAFIIEDESKQVYICFPSEKDNLLSLHIELMAYSNDLISDLKKVQNEYSNTGNQSDKVNLEIIKDEILSFWKTTNGWSLFKDKVESASGELIYNRGRGLGNMVAKLVYKEVCFIVEYSVKESKIEGIFFQDYPSNLYQDI